MEKEKKNYKTIFLDSLKERNENERIYSQTIKDFQKLTLETPSIEQLSQLNMNLVSTLRDKAQMVDSTLALSNILNQLDEECDEIRNQCIISDLEQQMIKKKTKELQDEKEELMTELKRRDEEIKNLYESQKIIQENNLFLKESNEQLEKDVINLEEVLLKLTSLKKYTNICYKETINSFPNDFLKEFEIHSDSVTQVKFHPQGSLIISGSDDCTIKIQDSITKNIHSILRGSLNGISSIDITNTHIISTSNEYITRLWNISKSKLVHTFHEHRNIVRSSVFLNSQKFFSSSFDKMIKLWDIDYNKSINTFTSGMDEPLFQVSKNSTMMASFSFKTVHIWNLNNLRSGKSVQLNLKKDISSIDLSENDQFLLVNYRDSSIDLIDLRKFKLLNSFQHIDYLNNQDFNHAIFSKDSNFISVGSDTGCVLIWNLSRNDPKSILRNSTNKPILSIDWNFDSSQLIFGSKDKTISLFGSK